MFVVLAVALTVDAVAQDADERYAKDLLQPGTEAPDFTLATPDGAL